MVCSQTVSEMQAVIGEELANASGNLAQAQSAADQAWAAYYSAEEAVAFGLATKIITDTRDLKGE